MKKFLLEIFLFYQYLLFILSSLLSVVWLILGFPELVEMLNYIYNKQEPSNIDGVYILCFVCGIFLSGIAFCNFKSIKASKKLLSKISLDRSDKIYISIILLFTIFVSYHLIID